MGAFEAAFVTGASSGLGRAIAIELARRGTTVHVSARREGELLETVREIERVGGRGHAHVVDVTDRAALDAAVREADDRAALDLVVAGAGISESGLEDEDRVDRARAILEVNLLGAIATIEAGIERLGARDHGTIACLSSLAGLRGLPGAAPYCASKAGLSTYVEARRIDLRGTGIRLVDVQPGFVRTALTARNRFPMPFLMDAEVAGRRTVEGLERGRAVVRYPRRFAWPFAALARTTPRSLWRAALARGDGS